MVQVRKLVLAIAAASALSSGMAQALGLGDVSLKSSLDQPLVAEIELLEVRDRFTRGLTEAQRCLAALRGLWARFAQRPVLTALIEGNMLARERLDDLLRRLDVREIPCLGKPFDPTLMQAAEVVQTAAAPPGTVLEVFRPGYTSNSRVLRFAEVKVAAGASASNQQSAISGQLDKE